MQNSMNYTFYQNGILRVYSPRKGRDWSFNWRKADDFVAPFLVLGLLIIVLIKLYG